MKQNKENGKRLVKITKEQYNRIFASKIINETAIPKMPVVKGGEARVEKDMAKALPTGSVKNLEEEKPFKIQNPALGISKSTQGNLKKQMTEGEDKVQGKVIELIHYLYGETHDFPQFKNPQGGVLTFDEIIDELLTKKLIVKKDGRFKLSKSSGSPEQAKQSIEDELNAMTGTSNPELETENYPAGVEPSTSNAPWNQTDMDSEEPEENVVEINGPLNTIGSNYEISILSDGKNYFVFLYGDLSEKPLSDEFVTDFAIKHKNEVGYGLDAWDSGKYRLIQIDEPLKQDLLNMYDLNFPLNEDDAIDAFNNFKIKTSAAMTPKKGIERTPEEHNAILAKLKAIRDAELAKRDSEKIQGLEEMTGTGGGDGSVGISSTGQYTGLFSAEPVKKKISKVNQIEVPVVKEGFALGKGYTHFAIFKIDGKIATGWDYSNLYDKNNKNYDNDSIKEYSLEDIKNDFPNNKFSDFKIVNKKYLEKNGIDTTNTNNWYKNNINENSQAFSKTQWSGGGFVEFNDCVDLNNKTAGTGCSGGAIDNVVSVKKTKGNVNAPSLSENQIYEAIAKKTGKTIAEIKTIITAKRTKHNNFTKN